MDAVGGSAAAGVHTVSTGSSTEQLHRLCRHLLGPGVSEDHVNSRFRSALKTLSSSPSAQDDFKVDEFAIAEQIKKFLIQDGRSHDSAHFSELHIKLQKSPIIKQRDSILTLFLNLAEKGVKRGPRRVPPFSLTPDTFTKSVISIGSDGESYLTKVIPQPYRTRPRTVNGSTVISPVSSAIKTPGYHPPIAPKPNYIPKSPCKPTVAEGTAERAAEGTAKKSLIATAIVPVDEDQPVRDEMEVKLLRELIYAFQGIEGNIVRKKDHRDEEFPGFSIAQEHVKRFTPSHVQMALKLAELGWLYHKVSSFCDQNAAERELGLIGQSLITGLKNELTEFYRLLAILESQTSKGMGLTLHQLTVCTMEPTERMKLLATIVKQCGRLRGGALISAIYGFLHHGDPMLSSTVKTLLTTVCKPMYNMILKWIFDGILEDPFTEFFIAADAKVTDESRLWHDKYSIRRSMIPKFMGLTLAKKILATGKSINFLRSVCQEDSPIPGRETMMRSLDNMSADLLFIDQASNKLQECIMHCYRETSNLVLDTMFRRYKLVEHVSAMRKYLLLGQGDLIRYLLELLGEELSEPATNLYPHNLAGILESAIRATNTQFEDPDILERLDVRLLDVQPGDSGWDVFSLDYKVGGPIGTVLGPNKTMTNYLMLFNALWRSKRMEWLLSCVWTRGTSLSKMARTIAELKPVLHLSHLLSSEMVHFVHQLAYYVTFEVMECSWDLLIKQLKRAENLDEVIEAHDEFLETLVKRALLDERSRELLTQLRAIYDRILEFQNLQNKLYLVSVEENEARRLFEDQIQQRSGQGNYGLTRADEQKDLKRRHEFVRVVLPNIETQLKIVGQSYQDMVRTFLLQLACSQDQSLQFLSVRLDFNEHYKRKDARLGAPLTYQHKRLSLM